MANNENIKNNENKQEKSCNCSDDCKCGCKEGKECNCSDDCKCDCKDGKECNCSDDCKCGCKEGKECNYSEGCHCDENKNSECSDDCKCGCKDGKKCTCDDDCDCGCKEGKECDCTKDNSSKCCHDKKDSKDEKKEYDKILLENIDLKKQLTIKENNIIKLQTQLNEINGNFVTTVSKKAAEAQEQLKKAIEENVKKFDARYDELKKYAIQSNAESLVDVIDNIRNVVNTPIADEKIKNWLFGFKMFVQQFDSILSDMSISKIDVKIGDEYNSDIMNASETIEDFNANDNTVAKVFNSAYKLHDRIIKHAGVVVVKNSKLN